MRAALTHSGLPAGVSCNDFRRIVKVSCRQIFKLPELAVSMIDLLFDQTQDGDFKAGRVCGSWMSARNIAARLGKSERRINEMEKQLEDEGLIQRTNGRDLRNGQRRGAIVWLHGINLAPLIKRASEIVALVADFERAQAQRDAALRQTHLEIRDLRRIIRETDDGHAYKLAEDILPQGRTSRIADLDRLREIVEALQAIVDAIETASGAWNFAHRSAENRAPDTTPESNSESRSTAQTPKSAADGVTLRQALTVATPAFRCRYEMQGREGWRSLEDTARQIAVEHGIRAKNMDAMSQRWSPQAAALSILLIDRNAHLPDGHRYRARSFARCFAGLARDPSGLVRMIRAAMGFPEVKLVKRWFEPEPVHPVESGNFTSACRGALSKIMIEEDYDV